MSYQVSSFLVDNNELYVNIFSNGKEIKMKLSIESNINLSSIPNKYCCVTRAHVIDSKGVGIYEPRLYRPFLPLPEGVRQCKQWEFDLHCSKNPDPKYPIDINALIWETFNEENYNNKS